ncbi:2Fe-2S iron-sulfur cluster-binding protein [Zhongshania guokunii]|uniref:2Fe-2S iron-sulfur cluster-binding protein n=1 Tax=Zhongshania guokunii TaxID=641783 RepID=A0ABV3UAC4_9GAMM
MTKIVFEDADGNRQAAEVDAGTSVMQAAMDSSVAGILADCGGGCSCATCHCFVTRGVFPDPDEIESQMLECVLEPEVSSRLSCQLIVREDMDGLVIKLPRNQI